MEMTRREFLKASGGLVFALSADFSIAAEATTKAIGAWVRIAPDGTVTIYSAGAEMGQGSSSPPPTRRCTGIRSATPR